MWLQLFLWFTNQGKEMIEMYFDFRLYRLWKTRQHSKLLDYEDFLWHKRSWINEATEPSSAMTNLLKLIQWLLLDPSAQYKTCIYWGIGLEEEDEEERQEKEAEDSNLHFVSALPHFLTV